MKTYLEVFYLRIVKDRLCFLRKYVNLSHRRTDPESVIHSLLHQTLDTSDGEIQREFVVHSTSWRYAKPGRVILTYVAYSDTLEFKIDLQRSLTLKQLKNTRIASGHPRTRAGREKQVVAHAMRHIAFLVQTDTAGTFKNAFTPRTRKVLESLWVSLAGRIS